MISGRALIGAALVVIAAAGVLAAHRAAVAPPNDRVVVMMRSVAAGTVLTADDLGTVATDLPDGIASIPAHRADSVIGSVALQDLEEMDLLRPTDVGDGATTPDDGAVVVPVEIQRSRALGGSVHRGSTVDVLSTDPEGSGTVVLASDVLVVEVDDPDADGIGAADSVGFQLALSSDEVASAVVDASVRSQLTLVLPNVDASPTGSERG